ncbi:3'-5' exonuclease [Pseudoalteromonas sp. SMS1]|uniref:3'-5' exonuclease n=1 Tax=Pseudoalteromonas sp. SMS1 TaxID=2908894 RepID=UPI001F25E358|nr:3'-5' exonuclease [Pseudoalteromonas sp. SMS1]MCF2856812.1 3'-5' exonuclease [Pseudoalteromonas sp. SMS1]
MMRWKLPWFFKHGAAKGLWIEREFVVLDLELTGLDSAQHEIVSVAWVIIKRGKIVLSQSRYMLNRGVECLDQSPIFHGIDDVQLEAGHDIDDIMHALAKVLEGRVLVCHNTPLDWSFIHASFLAMGITTRPTHMIDTLKIEKSKLLRQHPQLIQDHLRLPACRARYGLPDYQSHHALSDALATAELLLAQVNHLGAQKHIKLNALL